MAKIKVGSYNAFLGTNEALTVLVTTLLVASGGYDLMDPVEASGEILGGKKPIDY